MDNNQNFVDVDSRGYPVIFQKLRLRSWVIVFTLVAWFYVAGSKKAVLAQSQLEPTSAVKEAQVSVGSYELKAKMRENRLLRQELLGQIGIANGYIGSARDSLISISNQYKAELSQIDRQIAQTKALIVNTEKALASNQEILNDIRPAAAQGALSSVQVSRQEQVVNTLKSEIEQHNQEISRLQQEKKRLTAAHQSAVQTQEQKIAEQNQKIKQRRLEIKKLDREYEKLRSSKKS
jgi:chromosome segregation ATPase